MTVPSIRARSSAPSPLDPSLSYSPICLCESFTRDFPTKMQLVLYLTIPYSLAAWWVIWQRCLNCSCYMCRDRYESVQSVFEQGTFWQEEGSQFVSKRLFFSCVGYNKLNGGVILIDRKGLSTDFLCWEQGKTKKKQREATENLRVENRIWEFPNIKRLKTTLLRLSGRWWRNTFLARTCSGTVQKYVVCIIPVLKGRVVRWCVLFCTYIIGTGMSRIQKLRHGSRKSQLWRWPTRYPSDLYT
jgi:hypothetical protein